MKNIIAILVLSISTLGFAQAKKTMSPAPQTIEKVAVSNLSPSEIGKKNLADLAAFTPLTNNQKSLLLELFTTKAAMMADSSQFSEERKAVVAQSITYKMESVLSPETMTKIRANKTLFASLVN